MSKALFVALTLLAASAQGQVYTRFGPANGILVGDASTYQTSAAEATDVISLWTGTCNASSFLRGDGACGLPSALEIISQFEGTCDDTTFLRGDGECAEVGAGVSAANPTASVGLTAVNGSADTYMRSDAAPALSQSIAPTWTGSHTFTATTVLSSTSPVLWWAETDASTNEGNWLTFANNGQWRLASSLDASPTSAAVDAILVDRTGGNFASIDFTATNIDFNGIATVDSTTPRLRLYDSNAGAHAKYTEFNGDSGFCINLLDDSAANPTSPFCIARSGTQATNIAMGAPVSINSGATGQGLIVNSTASAGSYATFQRSGTSFGDIENGAQMGGSFTTDSMAIAARSGNPIEMAAGGSTSPQAILRADGIFQIRGASPRLYQYETGAGTDAKGWGIIPSSGAWYLGLLDDSGNWDTVGLSLTRSGTNPDTFRAHARTVVDAPSDTNQLLVTDGTVEVVTKINSSGSAWVGTLTDHDLNLMRSNQSKLSITSSAVNAAAGVTLQQNGVPVCLQDGTNCPAVLASGSYLPTTTNVANVSGSFSSNAQYLRVGDVVTVSGTINGTAGGAGGVAIAMSLPIASSLTSVEQVAGVATSTGAFGVINGDGVNDRAVFTMTASGRG